MVRKLLEFAAIQTLICLALVLPIEVCQKLARKLAFVFCDVLKFRHKVIDEKHTPCEKGLESTTTSRHGAGDVVSLDHDGL